MFVFLSLAFLGSLLYLQDVTSVRVPKPERNLAPIVTSPNPLPSPIDTKPHSLRETEIIKKHSDFSRLSVGSDFEISGISRGEIERFLGLVEFVEKKQSYIQFHVLIQESGKGVITVADDSVDIFLNTRQGVYQFSGDDFDGVVNEVKSVTWGDDIDYPIERPGKYPAPLKTFEVSE
tara:strand:+ start:37786 stop:38316 length:531 start_codon:yes stop_codon:yes gene_type:complete